MIRRKKKKCLGARSLVKGRRLVIKKWKGKGKENIFFRKGRDFSSFFLENRKISFVVGTKNENKKAFVFFFASSRRK